MYKELQHLQQQNGDKGSFTFIVFVHDSTIDQLERKLNMCIIDVVDNGDMAASPCPISLVDRRFSFLLFMPSYPLESLTDAFFLSWTTFSRNECLRCGWGNTFLVREKYPNQNVLTMSGMFHGVEDR